MLKSISAALLAVSVLAAPAMAAGTSRTAHVRDIKAVQIKASVRNAHAEMGRHHHHHRHFHRHHFHKR
jgi:Ni/Co efflux regulator RcnB